MPSCDVLPGRDPSTRAFVRRPGRAAAQRRGGNRRRSAAARTGAGAVLAAVVVVAEAPTAVGRLVPGEPVQRGGDGPLRLPQWAFRGRVLGRASAFLHLRSSGRGRRSRELATLLKSPTARRYPSSSLHHHPMKIFQRSPHRRFRWRELPLQVIALGRLPRRALLLGGSEHLQHLSAHLRGNWWCPSPSTRRRAAPGASICRSSGADLPQDDLVVLSPRRPHFGKPSPCTVLAGPASGLPQIVSAAPRWLSPRDPAGARPAPFAWLSCTLSSCLASHFFRSSSERNGTRSGTAS